VDVAQPSLQGQESSRLQYAQDCREDGRVLIQKERNRRFPCCGNIQYGAGATVRVAIQCIPSEAYVFVFERYPLGIAFNYLLDAFRDGLLSFCVIQVHDGAMILRR